MNWVLFWALVFISLAVAVFLLPFLYDEDEDDWL